MSLTLLLHALLVHRLHFHLSDAAKLIGEMMFFSGRTVREWQSLFVHNEGSFPDSEQGHYLRTGVLWQNEELNEAAQ